MCLFVHSNTFQDQYTPLLFVYPGLIALGPQAQSYAYNLMAPSSFKLASGVQAWPVQDQSASFGVSLQRGVVLV